MSILMKKKWLRFIVLIQALWVLPVYAEISEDTEITPMPSMQEWGAIQSFDAQMYHGRLEVATVGRDDGKNQRVMFNQSSYGVKNWEKSVAIDYGEKPIISKRGNDIQIAASGRNRLIIMQQSGDLPGTGPLIVSASRNGGNRWKSMIAPVEGDELHNEGYADIVADNDGHFHLVWLDDREENGNTQALRAAVTRDNAKSWVNEPKPIDAAVCTCCWTRLCKQHNGTINLLYRGHEPQDMRLAQIDRHSEWEKAGRVGSYDWDFNGCPHSGGGIASSTRNNETTLHALVWTGKQGLVGLHYLRSMNAGLHWIDDRLIDAEGRDPDLAASTDKSYVVASWTHRTDQGIRVAMSISRDNGMTWSEVKNISESGYQADHPIIAVDRNEFYILWTQRQGDGEKYLAGIALKMD